MEHAVEESSTTIMIDRRLQAIGLNKKDCPQHEPLRRASVLVVLVPNNNNNNKKDDSYRLLLTKRPDTMNTHAGEVCFPGGKQDREDNGDDVVTALRETHEEVGIHSDDLQVLARLPTLESYTGLCVTPVIAKAQQSLHLNTLVINTAEVEAVFMVPLDYFTNDNNLTDFQTIEWRGGTFDMRTYEYPDAVSGQTFKVWGLTAYIAHQVACLATTTAPSTLPNPEAS